MKLLTITLSTLVLTLSGCAVKPIGVATGEFGRVELFDKECKLGAVKEYMEAVGASKYWSQMREGNVQFSEDFKSQGLKDTQICYLGKKGAEGVLIVDTVNQYVGPLGLDQPLSGPELK